MPSEKFRISTNGKSLRNPKNAFFDMTLSSNMTVDTNDVSANNDRRSAHNALERQRREHLNSKFQQLAHALPSLKSIRRPSKTTIVAKSLEFVTSSLKRESQYMSEIKILRQENEKLRRQAETSALQLKNQQRDDGVTIKAQNDTKAQISPPPTPEIFRMNDKKEYNHACLSVNKASQKPSLVQKNPLKTELALIQPSPPAYQQLSPPSWYSDNCQTVMNPDTLIPKQEALYDTYIPSNDDIMFMTPNSTTSDMYDSCDPFTMQTPMSGSYHNMMNPMLLAPYYIQQESNEFQYSSEQRDHFYMS
ncbi:hypothetical protein K501DRAFT_252185 [Backusella circina FSU 941]|nr:hypothetical protein K501DRAFT_252185 [Backusella circina FSU 941]